MQQLELTRKEESTAEVEATEGKAHTRYQSYETIKSLLKPTRQISDIQSNDSNYERLRGPYGTGANVRFNPTRLSELREYSETSETSNADDL